MNNKKIPFQQKHKHSSVSVVVCAHNIRKASWLKNGYISFLSLLTHKNIRFPLTKLAEQSGKHVGLKWSERSACAAPGHCRQNVVATIECVLFYFLAFTCGFNSQKNWGLMGSALNFLWWVGGEPTNYFVTPNFS
jgi:hypothetical protein